MHTLIEDAAMIGTFLLLYCTQRFFSIGELDLAILDYSVALEIDSKQSQNTSNTNDFLQRMN